MLSVYFCCYIIQQQVILLPTDTLILSTALRAAAAAVRLEDERRLFHNSALRKRRKEAGEQVDALKKLNKVYASRMPLQKLSVCLPFLVSFPLVLYFSYFGCLISHDETALFLFSLLIISTYLLLIILSTMWKPSYYYYYYYWIPLLKSWFLYLKENGEVAADGDSPRQHKGVQYPFAVNEKVLIKVSSVTNSWHGMSSASMITAAKGGYNFCRETGGPLINL